MSKTVANRARTKKRRIQNQGEKSVTKSPPTHAEPTPFELASLAVKIGQKRSDLAEIDLLREALAYWLNAQEMLERWRTNPAGVFPESEPEPTPEPTPKKFPVTLDRFLSRVLPNLSGKSGEKHSLFREYLGYRIRHPSPPALTWAYPNRPPNGQQFDCCNPNIVPMVDDPLLLHSLQMEKPKSLEPTKENVDRYYELWSKKGIPDPGSFHYHVRHFSEWYQAMHAAHISEQRREAGKKGHANRKLKKQKPNGRRGARPPLKRLQKALSESKGT